ncbi:unnamed protein product [Peniophora sp. CBMAI 1063]|nr:unnamed protein product [Peniophora sp. CBMAI 1063]
MNAQKDFDVAIVGGGITGLILAIALARVGLKVDVFEAASKYGEIGAGVGIGPNALRVLETMGILDEVLAHCNDRGRPMPIFKFVRAADPHDEIYKYESPGMEHQGLGLHRAAFLKALVGLIPAGVRSHFSKRCVSISASPAGTGRVHLRFADGSVHETDVVVGADGIKSTVRMQVFGAKGDRLVDTGSRIYRDLVPMQRLLDAGLKEDAIRPSPRCWLGQDKHLVTFPIMHNTVLNVGAVAEDYAHKMVPAGPQDSWTSWVEPASPQELMETFNVFGTDARAILGCMNSPNKWKVHGLYPPLETFVAAAPVQGKSGDSGEGSDVLNVALIGDAAHAMLPYLGAGAGTGIEDAYVLASLLTHPRTQRANLSDVLRAYDTVRVPRAASSASHINRIYRQREVVFERGKRPLAMTVTSRLGKRQHEEEPAINEPGFCISCDGCGANLTHSIRLKCADPVCTPGDGIDLCPRCFCEGKEFNQHKRHHPYRVVELHAYPIFSEDWGADEELLLVDGISQNGLGNWEAIAEHIGTRTKEEVEEHYKAVYLKSPHWPLPITDRHFDIEPSEFQERKRRRISSMPTAPPAPKVAPTSAPGIHEIATYLPGRLEFEHEPDNDAEELIKDLMFGLVMQWGGDQLQEDEKDKDVIKRTKWVEERKAALEKQLQQQQQPQLPISFDFNGTTNGAMPNGFHLPNGSADRKNGFDKRGTTDRKDKRDKKKEDEDEGEEDDEDNEDNLPPIPLETDESIRFKLTVIDMYLQRVERREQGKQLIFQRGLLEYKKMQAAEKKRPKEEKEIIHRLRPFAKLQTAEDYEQFCADTLYESLLRKRIAELQAFRRNGLTTPADLHSFELDGFRRSGAKANMARELHARAPSGRSSLQPDSRRANHDDSTERDGTPKPGGGLRKPPAPLNLANSPLLHLLTPAEQTLCSTLRILPKPYLVIKETLVREYARRGGKLRRREARDLVKIDVNKTSRVWDFLMQAGVLRIGDSSAANANTNAQMNGNFPTTPAATPAPSTQAPTPSPSKPAAPNSSQHALPPPPAPPQLASALSSSSTSSIQQQPSQFSNGPVAGARMFPGGAGGPAWVPPSQ